MSLAADDEDAVSERLWDLGSQGTESVPAAAGRVELLAYFRPAPDLPARLAAALSDLPGVSLAPAAVPEVDWVARVREAFRAFRVGAFVVAPAWETPPPLAPGEHLLRVEPGRAFGTGSHETTRLCLRALERLAARRPLGRVLDLGCGSGILGLAAARLGARPVVALDNDPDAVASARLHAELNQLPLHLVRADGARALAPGRFDLVLANITAPLLVERRAEIAAALAPAGSLVLAGLLQDDRPAVEAAYATLGHARAESEGEWVSLSYGEPA